MPGEPRAQRELFTPPPGFERPDDGAPLDEGEALRATPADATVKGLFFQTALDVAASQGKVIGAGRRYAPFHDYSMREFNAVLFECARAIAGADPMRAAVSRIGARAFPAFAETLLGRVLYGVYRGRLAPILSLAPRGFELSQQPGRVRVEQVAASTMLLRFQDTYTQVDTYHVGIVRGALEACAVDGEVWVRAPSAGAGDLLVHWRGHGG